MRRCTFRGRNKGGDPVEIERCYDISAECIDFHFGSRNIEVMSGKCFIICSWNFLLASACVMGDFEI